MVEGNGPSLMGGDWFQKMQLDWANIKTLTTHKSLLTLHQLTKKYDDVFRPSLGTMSKFKARLHLKGVLYL